MLLNDIADLGRSKEQAVIINVGTRTASTLALLSALRHAEMPVLVIDCESKDGSWEHFLKLMESHSFDLLSAPLKPHWDTLDWLFGAVASEIVLLIDSDAEILDANVVRTMKAAMDDGRVFGSGFSHGPGWLEERQEVGMGVGYYPERMWISLTMLRVSHIRDALEAGESFTPELRRRYSLARRIWKALRRRVPQRPLPAWTLAWSSWLKSSYSGPEADYVFFDTGARVYQFLRHQKVLHFVGLPAEVFHERYVAHYHGVTRSTLNAQDPNCTALNEVSREIEKRLQQVYGYRL